MRVTLNEESTRLVQGALKSIPKDGEAEFRTITAAQLVNDAVKCFLGDGAPDGYFGIGSTMSPTGRLTR